MTDHKLPEVPVISVEGESISLSEGKSQVLYFLATRNLANLEKSPAVAPEEMASINVLAGGL